MTQAQDSRAKLIADVVTRLRAAMPDLLAIYRFGTWGTQDERADSDLDLAVLVPVRLPAARLWEIAQQLAELVGRHVDLVDLRAASTVMTAQIVSQGERLFCSAEKQCAEYEDCAYASYARLNEERREILQDILQRGQVYGG